MREAAGWLLVRNGYYWRPGRAGYTASAEEAGRYTLQRHQVAKAPSQRGRPMRALRWLLGGVSLVAGLYLGLITSPVIETTLGAKVINAVAVKKIPCYPRSKYVSVPNEASNKDRSSAALKLRNNFTGERLVILSKDLLVVTSRNSNISCHFVEARVGALCGDNGLLVCWGDRPSCREYAHSERDDIGPSRTYVVELDRRFCQLVGRHARHTTWAYLKLRSGHRASNPDLVAGVLSTLDRGYGRCAGRRECSNEEEQLSDLEPKLVLGLAVEPFSGIRHASLGAQVGIFATLWTLAIGLIWRGGWVLLWHRRYLRAGLWLLAGLGTFSGTVALIVGSP